MGIRISGINSGMDTESMVQELVKSYSAKTDNIKKDQTRAKWKQEAYGKINTKIKNFYGKLSSLRYSSAYTKKSTSVSDSSKVSVVTGDNAVKGTQTIAVKQLAKAGYLTGGEISLSDEAEAAGKTLSADSTLEDLGVTSEDGKITLTKGDGSTLEIDANKDTKISDVTKALSAAGVNANFDSSTGRIFVSSKDSGAENDFSISGYNGDSSSLDALGLSSTKGATKIDGQDSKIVLNGAEFTSSTNNYSINGLTITAKDVTETGEEVTLSTDTDYDGVYDTIKGFIKEYSTLINELDKLYNAESSRGYDPLTSEEKEALTDEEVEDWENKIKDSLLRRDENISSVANMMKSAMSSLYEIGSDKTKMSLSDFGIETLGYFNSADNEKNAYHIDGDPDDTNTSGKTDKLKAALISDPEGTTEFFQKLAGKMYDSLSEASRSTSNRTFGNFYDDKKVKDDYEAYEDKLSEWEDYVSEIEDKYYKQFSAMETALSKLNSQQSYIGGMLG